MPWLIGLVDEEERAKIEAAGYEITEADTIREYDWRPLRSGGLSLEYIAVWLYGDVGDHLILDVEEQ